MWAETRASGTDLVRLPDHILTFCLVELKKIRHDPWEMATRLVQPVLWLLLFGETFTRLPIFPTGNLPYLSYLAPGIIAQSALFVAIFYGIQLVWERDAGILTKILTTPTPRGAIVSGKAFAAALRGLLQALVVFVLAGILGVAFRWSVPALLGAVALVMVGAAFFACVSMVLAGLAQQRERLMGIGQAITFPLFFASNALYPTSLMPGWLQAISEFNPLSYEVDGLRGLLVGTPSHLALDFVVLLGCLVGGVLVAARLLTRLVR
ncbi:MAG: ABC transporter permease [Thermoplasmata archaeon]